MNKKNVSIMVAIAVVFAAGGFFGGTKYAQAKRQSQISGARGNFAAAAGANGAGFTGRGRAGGAGGAAGGGFVTGSIISKDDKSITVQLPNNAGTKIVFLADSSQIMKSTAGAAADLTTGENVTVTGTTNSDGSVTAQNISIRPAMPTAPPAGQ